MLNKDNVRELAYVVRVDDVIPHPNADRLDIAKVGGWHCIVGKGDFQPGDLAVYFEIDSKLPDVEPFHSMEFLASKHFKIKTQKIRGEISQGLLMSAENFGWKIAYTDGMGVDYLLDPSNLEPFREGTFLTERLGVTYAVAEDNRRKAPSGDKYKKMALRNPALFKKPFIRKLMQYEWGKKLLFLFFGNKKDKRNWPAWVIKTDEERVQNMPWILNDKDPWIATEKIDGTSTTFTMRRTKKLFKDNFDFYVCSRNVVFDTPDKQCYYDTNFYTAMAEKYHIEELLKEFLITNPNLEWVTLQGETFGSGVQKRDYSMKDVDFRGFNFITSAEGRWNSVAAANYFKNVIPWVPILDEAFVLPNTVEELIDIATGKSQIDGLPREGIVFRSQDGTRSFKAVSNDYLLKYHQ